MAIIDNIIMKGAQGKFGKEVVFRQRNGKTIMCKVPKPYPPKTPTQVANQERFAKANAFAKAAIADPVKKAQYQKRANPGQSAYNVAFVDAFHGAAISEVSVSDKVVTVKMRNDHSVKEVKVDGELATFNKKKEVWEYVTKKKARKVEAFDVMGNVVVKEIG
ncbi:hypothetical protein GFS24_10435 [Chitinophaga sp. SYP-B3965]|uniref:hypothetical protein n=1 Tax=Chitinophaga sp. SYP-B3965 TaxID=2663120 RepID=UPI001299D6F6|nr:hypothetical protein [Chitinophaga sp. SYP-B3965]MRG45534.1 hypothetical protein [Chitinophaga sp. SYP-B3965]